MSNLNEISIDKIETDIMSILYANINIKFTQYTLYNKLIMDKYNNDKNLTHIQPNFKSKYLLVLMNLMSKYDDIEITKINNVYNIVCYSTEYSEITLYKETSNINKLPIDILNKNDIKNMYDYICENLMNQYIKWTDQFNGNSIYHELIINNNTKQIQKLIDQNKFDYFIKNKDDKTPVDMINSISTSKIIIDGLLCVNNEYELKLNKLNHEFELKLNKLNNDINFNNKFLKSDELKNLIINDTTFLNFILIKTKKYHPKVKMCVLLIIGYLMIKVIF